MSEYTIGRVLLTEEKIAETVARLGREITAEYRDSDREMILVGLLKGSFIFMADLARAVDHPLSVDFMMVSSYGDGTVSSADVKVVMDLDTSIEGKDVIVVEDIVDTGNTFSKVLKMLKNRKPHTLRSCAFLSKPSRRVIDVRIDWIGEEIDDEFVIGYGMDFGQKYRNIKYIGVLEETDP